MLKITSSAQIKLFFSNILKGRKFKTTLLKRDTPKVFALKQDFVVAVQLEENDVQFSDNFVNYLNEQSDKFYVSKVAVKLPISVWNTTIRHFDVEDFFDKSLEVITPKVKVSASELSKSSKVNTPNTKDARNLNTFETIQALIKEKGYYDSSKDNYANSQLKEYTSKDLELIKNYEGRGGLKGATLDTTSTGALNEFYTPEQIANIMYSIAFRLWDSKVGRILEPSVGTGRLISRFAHKKGDWANVTVDAYEKDPVSATICKLLYPYVNVFTKPFETTFYTGNLHTPTRAVANYDLVIGNPPYEKTGGLYIKEYESVGATQFDQYFLMRGLDVLKSGGLLIMIIPSTFLRNDRLYNQIKEQIAQKADLLQAFRLPNDVFPNTGVGTDIVCFRKK